MPWSSKRKESGFGRGLDELEVLEPAADRGVGAAEHPGDDLQRQAGVEAPAKPSVAFGGPAGAAAGRDVSGPGTLRR